MDFRGGLKRMEFPSSTPVRNQPSTVNDFQSSQKLKYEHATTSRISQPQPYIPKENTTIISKEIHDTTIPVKFKSYDREDWQTYLNLKIILNQSSQAHGQVLHLELTEETNYQFLQVLDLSEGEFLQLKNDQSLHVDFTQFPHMIAELLRLSINSHKDERVTFFITVDVRQNGECYFSVVENNEFKRLTHLTLRFRGATDETLKNYLSQKLSKFMVDNEDLKVRCKKLEDISTERSWEIEQLQASLRKFHEEKEATVQQLLNSEQRKLNEMKEEALFKETNFVREMESEKRLMVDKYERIINDLNTKLSRISETNAELMEQRATLSNSERDLINKLKVAEKEVQLLGVENQNFKQENRTLEANRFSQEKQITELTITAQSLEKQLQDKLSLLENKREMIDNTNKQNEIISDQLNSQKKQIEKLESKVSQCTEEINKGNSIIEKLQADLLKQKEKIKTKNAVVLQQEQIVQQLQEQNDTNSKTINQLKREIDELELKLKDSENQKQVMERHLKESADKIKDNLQMIQYLNQQINQSNAPIPQVNPLHPVSNTFKSATFTSKYVNPVPVSEDFQSKTMKNFQNTSVLSNQLPLTNTTQLSNRFTF